MSNIYYTSLSGMLAASYGLQNTSNNVANMQSPGFKGSDVFYSSLGSEGGFGGLGAGVTVAGKATNFTAGKYLDSASPSDLAIIGQGFFIVRMKNGEYLYTRDGEFVFNEDGFLTDRHSGGLVQGYNSAGHLTVIQSKGPDTVSGKATQRVYLKGKWPIDEGKTKVDDMDPTPADPNPNKKAYKDVNFTLGNIYDDQGKSHKISLRFEVVEGSQGTDWRLAEAHCDDNLLDLPSEQLIKFYSINGGSALDDYSSIELNLHGKQSIKLYWGTKTNDTDASVNTQDLKVDPTPNINGIELKKQDGYGIGKQISYSFNKDGQIIYHYDNGQDSEGIHVGLAHFDDMENNLSQTSANLFRAKDLHGRHLGRPNHGTFGAIQASKLESANVDATTEFANIVILQRMFQACSQIMEIDKQLIQELSQQK